MSDNHTINEHVEPEDHASLPTFAGKKPDPQSIPDNDVSLRTISDKDSGPHTMRDSDRSLNTMFDGNVRASETFLNSSGTPGRFRILRPHARGGLGQVSVALDQELNREVALKEILTQYSDDQNSRERFVLEAEITGGLEHPGIVPVYGLGQREDGRPYYAMRFIKGDSLKQSIEEFHRADNPNIKDPGEKQLALRQLLDRFIDVCNAVEYAHSRGVLHRDLKPANIMVGKFGETLVVDWGLAKAIGQREVGADAPFRPSSVLSGSVQTMLGSAIGTPAYMSPEQAAGKLDELGPATDIYSLGATLYHLLCDRPPFEKEDLLQILIKVRQGEFPQPREIHPEISRSLEAICLKGMALKPADRYPTARAIADDVEHWLADEPISAAQDTASERLSRWARKHKGLVQVGSVSLALMTLILSIAYGVVSVSNSRLNTANETISVKNKEITGKNEELKTTNIELDVARTEAERKRDEARELVREASRSDVATAQALLADGKWREAMAYLGRSLRYDSDNINARDALWLTLRYGQRDATSLPVHLLRHEGAVLSANFRPDGKRVVTASRDNSARIWDIRTGKPVGSALKHKGLVNSANFSPDGNQVVTISDDRMVQIWDANTGLPASFEILNPDQIYVATFSPDGTRILTACGDGTARIWDVQTAMPMEPSLKHQDAVYFASFSPDGSRVSTASGDTTAQIWDARTGLPVGPPLRHQGAVYSANFSPDGTRVITASGDTTARIWNADTGQLINAPLNHDRSVSSGRFSPDGTRVLTASDDKTARVWNAQTGKPVGRPLVHDASVAAALFSTDGTRIITASDDQTARIWDAQSGQSIGQVLHHAERVNIAMFSPDGMTVVTASDDLTACLWNAQSGHPSGPVLKHDDSVYNAVFSPDGTRVVTASGDATARIWDAQTGQFIGLPLSHNRSITNVQFSSDGTRIVTASDDSTARIWNAQTGQPMGTPLVHGGVVIAANFSPNGMRIVTASHDGTGRIWDAHTGQPIGMPLKHDNFVSCANFSPDDAFVVTASRDKAARVWNAQTGEPIGRPLRHEDAIYFAGFSPDSTHIVTASRDKTARIWDTLSGQPFGSPLLHQDAVYIAAYFPDGLRILTVNEDRSLRIWTAKTGEPIGMPLIHESRINSAGFGPNGTRIVSANEDKTARIWDADTGQSVGPPLVHDAGLNNASFSPDGTQIVTANEDKTARIWGVRSLEYLDGTVAKLITNVIAGAQLGQRMGILEQISTEQRLKSVNELQSSLASDSDWSLLIQMDLDPKPDSRISPRSMMTRRQAVTNLIHSNSPQQIRQAMILDPGHPLIQIALASLKEYSGQADFLREYGVIHLPGETSDCHDAAEMLKTQKDFSRSIRVIEKLFRLQPDRPETIRLIETTVDALRRLPSVGEFDEWLRLSKRRLAEHYEAAGQIDKAAIWNNSLPADALRPLNVDP